MILLQLSLLSWDEAKNGPLRGAVTPVTPLVGGIMDPTCLLSFLLAYLSPAAAGIMGGGTMRMIPG
jgi:hypothetical protein